MSQAYKDHALLQEKPKEVCPFFFPSPVNDAVTWMTPHGPLTAGGDQSFSLHTFKNSFFSAGGNPRGRFALGLVQSEWKVYVKRPLDREEQDMYFLNITATDGLFVTQAMVEVTVSDVNDNSPVCDQVRRAEMSALWLLWPLLL